MAAAALTLARLELESVGSETHAALTDAKTCTEKPGDSMFAKAYILARRILHFSGTAVGYVEYQGGINPRAANSICRAGLCH